jgi:zinc transport system ATP-binding protein
LAGPNGAGKSTLFLAILGLIEFTGRIRFQWRQSGRIGYVPQLFAVDRTLPLTVGEFLAMSRQRRPICFGVGHSMRRHLDALLATVGLERFLDRPLGALSGGELQRVLLANAIDPQPELLLLDEPGSGLDESSSRRFEEILHHVASLGTGVLMVSHDLAQVRRMADWVTVIDREMRRSGSPAEVVTGNLSRSLALS